MRPSAQQLLQHERLDLAYKLANMERMCVSRRVLACADGRRVKQVRAMKGALQAKEAELDARDEQRTCAFTAFLAQKENEARRPPSLAWWC